jgi:hypothetical protein
MKMNEKKFFENKNSEVYETYQTIVDIARQFGPVELDIRRNSILLRNTDEFGGVHPKMHYLDVVVVTNRPLRRNQIVKLEQVSTNRFKNYFRFGSKAEISDEFVNLFREAYELAGRAYEKDSIYSEHIE